MEQNYVKNLLNQVFSVKSLYSLHYYKYPKFASSPIEQHDYWELVYIDSGSAKVVFEKQLLLLKPGQAVLHSPSVSHTIGTGNDTSNVAIIAFECTSRAIKGLKNKIFNFGETEKRLLQEILIEAELTYKQQQNNVKTFKMSRYENVPFGSEQLIKNNLENLLIFMSRSTTTVEAQTKLPTIRSNKDDVPHRIINMLKGRIYSDITLDEIANELYFSKTYIKNIFRKHTGTSVIQYYLDLKIEEAKKLIANNKFSFTEISDKLNFNSVHYFSRTFKQRTGMSPSEYAKSVKSAPKIK